MYVYIQIYMPAHVYKYLCAIFNTLVHGSKIQHSKKKKLKIEITLCWVDVCIDKLEIKLLKYIKQKNIIINIF